LEKNSLLPQEALFSALHRIFSPLHRHITVSLLLYLAILFSFALIGQALTMAMRGSRLPVGSTTWIAEERTAAAQITRSEVEEFTFSARNDFDWLNEHMAGFFDENEMYESLSCPLSRRQ
jgi:hypothetical protein